MPNAYVLGQIASHCDMPLTYFDDPDLTPDANWNGAALLGKIVEGAPDWTDDEVAFVRILRLVPVEVAAKVAGDLVEAATHNQLSGVIAQFASLARDVASLLAVKERGGLFRKGPVDLTEDILAGMAATANGGQGSQ